MNTSRPLCSLLLLATGCAPFAPASGDWTTDNRFVTTDECGLTEGEYTEPFSLSDRGEEIFFLVYGEDVRVCTLSAQEFDCNDLEESAATVDADTTLIRSFSGSFEEEYALILYVDYQATCAGAGCLETLGIEDGGTCAASMVIDLSTTAL